MGTNSAADNVPYLALGLLSPTNSNGTINGQRNQLLPNAYGDTGKLVGDGAKDQSKIEMKEANKQWKQDATATTAADLSFTQGVLSDNVLEEFYKTPMSFGTQNLTMVTSQIGATAFLPCRVHYIGEGVVSGNEGNLVYCLL